MGNEFLATEKMNDNVSWQSNLYYASGILGYGFYLASVLGILAGFDFLNGVEVIDKFDIALTRIAFLFAYIVMLLIVWLFSDFFSKKTGAYILTFVSLMMIAPFFSCLIKLPMLLSFAAGGVGSAAAFMTATPFLSSLNHRRIFAFTSFSFVVAMCVLTGFPFFPKYIALIFWCFIILATVFALFFARYIAANNMDITFSEESRNRNKSSLKSMAAAIGNSMCIGFTVYCISMYVDYEWRFILISFIAVLAAILVIVDILKKETLICETFQLKYSLPCLIIGLLPMAFFGKVGCLIGGILMTFVFAIQFITNICAVSENVSIFHLSPIHYFSASRIVNIIGLLFGYIFGAIAFGEFVKTKNILTVVIFGIIAIFVFLTTFFYQGRYPSKSDKKANREIKGVWMQKCDILAERSGLTQREREILCYLAKGHDKEYIQSKLFISQSTIKSHIYNIYQKNNIHSKKELVSLIEKIEIQDRQS